MSVKTARACDIEQQLAQLRWHRMQNERSIRRSLEATKVLKQKDAILGLTVDHASNKAMRVSSIIRDELTRPLIITDEELHEIQKDDNRVKKRLDKYANMQLDNVDKLTHMLETRLCRTKDGIRIRDEQMELLEGVKQKLQNNIRNIDQRKPYVDVKLVVEKIF
jgi:hypothetical protein